MTDRYARPDLGLARSSVISLVNYVRREGRTSLRFLAVSDWVAFQLALAQEKKALLLGDASVAVSAGKRVKAIDAQMTQEESDLKKASIYIIHYRSFETGVFNHFLRDAQKAVSPNSDENLTNTEQRIWAAQRVFQVYPRLRRARM